MRRLDRTQITRAALFQGRPPDRAVPGCVHRLTLAPCFDLHHLQQGLWILPAHVLVARATLAIQPLTALAILAAKRVHADTALHRLHHRLDLAAVATLRAVR